MKPLQSGKENWAMLGISPSQSLISLKFLMALFIIVANAGLNWAFLIYEADSFREYTNSIFITSTTTMVAVCFGILAFQRPRIYKLFYFTEEQIEKSE